MPLGRPSLSNSPALAIETLAVHAHHSGKSVYADRRIAIGIYREDKNRRLPQWHASIGAPRTILAVPNDGRANIIPIYSVNEVKSPKLRQNQVSTHGNFRDSCS